MDVQHLVGLIKIKFNMPLDGCKTNKNKIITKAIFKKRISQIYIYITKKLLKQSLPIKNIKIITIIVNL